MLACCILAETYESRSGPVSAFRGRLGFQPDDALSAAGIDWARWLAPMLLAAAAVTTVIALIIFARYLLQLRHPTVSRTR